MNAAIDAAATRLRCRVRKRIEPAAHTRQPDAGGVEGSIAQDFLQHQSCRRAVGGMSRNVFRMVRGDQQRLPAALSGGFGVAVAVGVANGRDRTPEVVGVLGVPGGDAGIGQGHIQDGQQSGRGAIAEAIRRRLLIGDLVPVAGRGVAAEAISPEAGNLGLLRCSSVGGGGSEAFDFV